MSMRSPGQLMGPLFLVGVLALAVPACEQGASQSGGSGGGTASGGKGSGGVTSSVASGGGQTTARGGSGGAGGSVATGGTSVPVSATGGNAGTSTATQPRTGGAGGSSGGSTGTGGVLATGGAGARDAAADLVADSAADVGGDVDIGLARDSASDGKPGTGGAGSGGTGTGGTGTGGTGGTGTGGGTGTADIKVWLAGDSTVANGSTPCPVGWGKQFQALFNAHVTVTNSAQGGRSVQTWLYDVSTTMGTNGECNLNSTTYLSPWSTMLSGMKPGDFLFIQFGINDASSTCNRHVGTALFQEYYGMMAKAAKDRGANPVFVTPVSSISCSGSKAVATRGAYATATKQAGMTYGVPVIDLESLSVGLYTSLGFCPLPGPDSAETFASGAIGDFFCEDHTHFEAGGATQIAGLIAKALRDQGIGLAGYLK